MVAGVATMHPAYQRSLYAWIMVRDSIEGESMVKSKGSHYLPMPAAMLFSDYSDMPASIKKRQQGWWLSSDPVAMKLTNAMMDPNYDPNPAFAAYLSRAQFPELASFILRGLSGLTMSDMPTVKLPERMQYLVEMATPQGLTLNDLYLKAVVETLITGRFTMILNIDLDGIIRILPYNAESLVNWKTRSALAGKASNAAFLVFEEFVDSEDDFEHDAQPQYHVARDLGDVYVVEFYESDEADPTNIVTPNFMGKTLNYIPFVTVGSVTGGLDLNPIPMYSITSTAMQIYMRSADLGNSEFVSCNPTLVMTGVDKSDSPRALGPTVVLTVPNDQAKVFYTTTDTSALNHVMTHINDLFERAVYFGAQLLDSSKKAAESAETTRLKQASTGATLSSVVTNVANGIETILKMCADWMSLDRNAVEFKAVTDFMAPALTAAEQKTMVESWVAGAISKYTLVDNFRKSGLLPAGTTVEQEIARILSEEPVPAPTPTPGTGTGNSQPTPAPASTP